MSEPVRIDRYGREVRLDKYAMEYVKEDGDTWYITPCCDAGASVNDGPMYCKACFEDVDDAYGGVPEPLDEDMDDDERRRLEEWKAFERRAVARALGLPEGGGE